MKTYLIKGPLSDEEMVSSFPLIHYLKEENPDSKIALILNEGQNNLYNFLPFKVDVFYLPNSKSNLIGVHHFAVNLLDVFNVDVFIDLENSLKSSFLGFSFKAKYKIGYKNGMNSIFLTHKLENDLPLQNINHDEHYFDLYLNFQNKTNPDYKIKTFSKDKSYVEDKKNESILIVLSNTVDFKTELLKIFKEFDEKKIIISIVNRMNLIDGGDLVKEAKRIETKNNFSTRNFSTYTDLQNCVNESVIVITDIEWVSYIASYMGRESFLLLRKNKKMPRFKFFASSPIGVCFESGKIVMNMEKENQELSDIKALIDFIHKFLDMKI